MLKNQVRLAIILITGIISMVSTNAFSQNYRLVDKDREMTFARLSVTGKDSLFYFIKTDSVALEGLDSVYYFSTQFQNVAGDPDCEWVRTDTSILGFKMLIKPDAQATHVFFNQHGDSIFIKSVVNIGDYWTVYKWPDGSFIKATVVNKLERTILPDVEDTILRIQFTVFNALNVIMPDSFPTETKMDISKFHGLTEFFNFNIFPLPGDSIGRVLRGLTNPYENIVDVDAYRAYNFSLGYEFHYRETSVPDNQSDADKRISAIKYFIQTKTPLPDGVSYQVERVQYDTLYNDGVPSVNLKWDTIELTFNYADFAYLDAHEFTLFDHIHAGYSDWVKDTSLYEGVPHKNVYDHYVYNDATYCLSNPDNISQPVEIVGDGLGQIYYLDSLSADAYYELSMVYFQVGLITWGTPYDFSSLDVAINQLAVEHLYVYPNPTLNYLHIGIPVQDDTEMFIFDIQGRLVQKPVMHQGLINVSNLSPGMYTLAVYSENSFKSATFIKE
ncbi:MAG TPA: T9SS type A sorting domain-containing protein [Chitinophagales bacterium]|nr:T9SS type A sorting domain-containing protein [Chitinophagales bacterium]HMZ87885.1 T9SS type A sorting domain-containing protein [Chitinophagales bacterium]HNA58153.1 T9SS type A sorting domain-containing protein [Chitinophagales bacterium]HNE45861.1 T9SS type A sorting domain-containing protein [Chitinophagales bacterium]HNF67978.1 T9SS type A sorting domain-containing protein [Chitinophagales bacterium]